MESIDTLIVKHWQIGCQTNGVLFVIELLLDNIQT
jgi:hypothetical protein